MDSSKKYDNPNPRLSANFFNRLIFWWLKPLFLYGSYHNLEVKDIYNACPNDVSETLGNKLEVNWIAEMDAAKRNNKKPSLFVALKKTFIWSFAYYGGWMLFLSIVLRILQPYALGLLILHFDPRATSTVLEAYLYATSVVITALFIAIVHHHTYLGQMEIGMRMRIACSSLIYRKILRLSKSFTNTSTSGQIVNLLSNDVAKFEQLFVFLHYVWIMPIQAALIAFLIWQSVYVASLAGIFLITIQTIPLQGYMSKWMANLRAKIAVRTDERIRLMSEIIKGIQIIKMYTWEKPFEELVCLARSREIDVLTLTSYLRAFTLATFVFTERTTLYFTIIGYVLFGNNISADKVFSMATYFNILQATMAIFYPTAVTAAAEAMVSVKRIQAISANENNIISIKDVTASWTEDIIVSTLRDININIQYGKLYALIGPVGAGKSSILQLILGELQSTHGQVSVKSNVAYASQESWLFAGTIRNNILFGEPYDKDKYQRVVKACALTKDFDQLLHGDKTLVGDRGAGLSGGQRARINLARAVYRNVDIYLLDDPLSAVDTHVGKHLFDECIDGYLKDKTRVLITHQIQYLKKCDYIVIMNNGCIEYEGTFADLLKRRINLLDSLIVNDVKEDTLIKEINENLATDVPSNKHVARDEEKIVSEETEELMAKGTMPKSVYWIYFRVGGSIFMLSCLLISTIIGQIGSSGCDYWVAYWTNQEEIKVKLEKFTTVSPLYYREEAFNVTEMRTEMDLNRITNMDFNHSSQSVFNNTKGNIKSSTIYILDTYYALWIYGAFITTSILMTTTRNVLFYKICMNASKNLHNSMFSSLLKAPMIFFNSNSFGRILNRFSKDIGAVDEILPRTMTEALQIFAVLIGILLQVLIINWWTILPMLIMAFFYWKVRTIYLTTAQNIKRLEGITKSPVFSHVNSTLLGLITIRSSHAQSMLCKEFDKHQDLHTGAYFLSIATNTAFGFVLDVVSVAFVTFITYSFIILDNGNTFAGNVGLAISQVLILCGMLQYGIRQTAEAIAQMTSVERILQFTNLEKEGPFESEPSNKPSVQWPHKGDIIFNSMYLRYSKTDPPVLKNLNFAIQSGMKIGIVGRTGAGKSSLISALFHLSSIDGIIYIDGVDIKKIGLHDLRNKISIIPQEPMLFSATLRDNLDPFHKYTDDVLWAALEEVELKGAISSLDCDVYEDGSNFSMGQRQLLCLARAIIQNNKILLLDEATANVDPTTDSLIQNTIRRKFKDCTLLTIAHRLNTVMDSDKIMVLNHGQLVEFDHPYILLQNEDGYFFNLAKENGNQIVEQFKIISKEAYDKCQYVSSEVLHFNDNDDVKE